MKLTAVKGKSRWEAATPKQRKIIGGITAGVLVIGAANIFSGDEAGPTIGSTSNAGALENSPGMSPGDIGRWAEDLEDEYLAEYGLSEFLDPMDAPATVTSAIVTFDATTYGELKVYVWGWIGAADAEIIAEDVATTVASVPDAPSVINVSAGWDEPTLATSNVNR